MDILEEADKLCSSGTQCSRGAKDKNSKQMMRKKTSQFL